VAGVDWSTEWFTSILWVAGVTVAAAVACVLAAWALTRWTVWGRQLKRLAMPYFSPRREQGWRTLLNTLGILVLAIVAVRVQVVNSYIVNGLYTALQQLDAAVFLRYVGIFAVLSVVALAETLLSFYLQQRLVIHWRVWLNDRILRDWLDGGAYHRGPPPPSHLLRRRRHHRHRLNKPSEVISATRER
jgi:vitamin B12/bleomycin/antimicrobial peptide transport system ATP-binding/permease protein